MTRSPEKRSGDGSADEEVGAKAEQRWVMERKEEGTENIKQTYWTHHHL